MPESITRRAELESLKELREFISDCCTKHKVPKEIVFELKLAVDEACTNVIIHGYKDLEPGPITLAFRIETDRILVDITEVGHVFEPASAAQPDIDSPLEKRQLGGMGLFLINKTMDKVEYRSSETGNTLTFTKYIKGADSS